LIILVLIVGIRRREEVGVVLRGIGGGSKRIMGEDLMVFFFSFFFSFSF
jgi:hypothetical protein